MAFLWVLTCEDRRKSVKSPKTIPLTSHPAPPVPPASQPQPHPLQHPASAAMLACHFPPDWLRHLTRVFDVLHSSHVFTPSRRKKWNFLPSQRKLKNPLAGGPQCDWRRPLWSKRRGGSGKVCLNLLLLWKCRQPVAFRRPDVHLLALIRSWLPVKWTENWAPWERLQHQHSTCPILGMCACEAACVCARAVNMINSQPAPPTSWS